MYGTAIFLAAIFIAYAINPEVKFSQSNSEFLAAFFWIIVTIDVALSIKKLLSK